MIFINQTNILEIKESSQKFCRSNLNTHIIITIIISAVTMLLEKTLGISHHYTVFPPTKEVVYFIFQHFIIAYIVATCMRNHHFNVREVFKELISKWYHVIFTGVSISLLSYGLLFIVYNLSKFASVGLKLVADAFEIYYLDNLITFTVEIGFYLICLMIYNLLPILSACILSKDTKRSLNVIGIFSESQRLISKKIIDYVIYFVSSHLIIYSALTILLEFISEKSDINFFIIYPLLIILEILSEIYILNFFMHIGDKHFNEVYVDEIKTFTHNKRKIDKVFKEKFEMVGLKAFYLILIYTLFFSSIKGVLLHTCGDNTLFVQTAEIAIDIIQFGLILRAVHKSIKYKDYKLLQIIRMNIKSISYILPIAIFVAIINTSTFRPILLFINNKITEFKSMLSSPIFMILSILIWCLIVSLLVIILEVIIISIYGMEIDRHENLNPVVELFKSRRGLEGNKRDFIKFIINNTIDILIYIGLLQFISQNIEIEQLINIINYAVFIFKAVFLAKLSISILIFIPLRLKHYISEDNIEFLKI